MHRRTDGLNVTIDLETTAGQGTSLGYRFEHLGAILDKVAHPELIGVCADTCHIFAAGYPLATPEEYDKTIDRLDRSVGLSKLRVWHLNDSCRDFGSRVDRHAAIGAGRMGLEPFRHLVNDPRFRDLPMILETPKGIEEGEDLDTRNLRVLRGLVRPAACSPKARLIQANRLSVEPAARRPAPIPTRHVLGGCRGPLAERTVMSTTQLNGPVVVPGAVTAGSGVEPNWFINRELSWLDFNERVLEEARDSSNPSWSGSGSWRFAHPTSTNSSRFVSRDSRPSFMRTSSRRTSLPTAWVPWRS